MKEISFDMAQYLYNSGEEVYLLFSDGTERLIEDSNEINSHKGIFGIEKNKCVEEEE